MPKSPLYDRDTLRRAATLASAPDPVALPLDLPAGRAAARAGDRGRRHGGAASGRATAGQPAQGAPLLLPPLPPCRSPHLAAPKPSSQIACLLGSALARVLWWSTQAAPGWPAGRHGTSGWRRRTCARPTPSTHMPHRSRCQTLRPSTTGSRWVACSRAGSGLLAACRLAAHHAAAWQLVAWPQGLPPPTPTTAALP